MLPIALQPLAQAPKAWARSFPETAGSDWLDRKDFQQDSRRDKNSFVHRRLLRSWKNLEADTVACQRRLNLIEKNKNHEGVFQQNHNHYNLGLDHD